MNYHMRRYRFKIFPFIFLFLHFTCSNKEEAEKSRRDIQTASWPIFRGDAKLSGMAEDKLPDKLILMWSFKTEHEIISSPVIGFGRVYIGSTDGKVYSIDLLEGKQVWAFDTGDDVEASPLLLDQTIYIGSLSGDFYALNAHTGRVEWKYSVGFEIYGSANWVRDPDNQEISVLVGSYDSKLYCFEAKTGKLKWTYETDNYINGAPATDGENVVFGGCDENLHIVSAVDGTKNGEVWAGSYIAGSAALGDNRAYLGHYGNKLVCIDIADQKLVWEYEDKENGGPFFSSPAVGKDRVLIGSRDGFLHCVNRETGQKVWTFRTRDEVDSSPVIAGDDVVIGSTDGRLYVVNLEDGKQVWSYEIGAAIISCPAVAAGMIVVGADDGCVYAFGEG